MIPATSAFSPSKAQRIAMMAYAAEGAFFRTFRSFFWPKIELLVRWWLAGIFFASGMLKLMNWPSALYLSTYEYPVPWLSAAAAARLGIGVEVCGAALLAAGCMTRYAALSLFLLSLVIQTAYRPLDSQLFWMSLLGWFVIHGAGPWSLDALLRRGLGQSALPVVPRIVRTSELITRVGTPIYLALLRSWLGLSLLWTSLGPSAAHRTGVALGLPLTIAGRIPMAIAAAVGTALLAGFATRYISGLLLIVLFGDSMMDPRSTDAVYIIMVLSVLVMYGAGTASLDHLIAAIVRGWQKRDDSRKASEFDALPHVVIVGAGFGGISCARGLRDAKVSVTLIDKTNHHLFQPLLYQVATGALSPGDIATPIRLMFRNSIAVRVMFDLATGIDTQHKRLLLGDRSLTYDYLVIATGAMHSYFGHPAWSTLSPGLKRLEDAVEVRRRVLTSFERAELANDAEERSALLTFLIVGGGPTGVELAGAIAELARFGMSKDFRTFDPAQARVILVQSAQRLLPGMSEKLAAIARRALERLGVEVRLASRVDTIDSNGVTVDGQRIEARTVLWAAGVKASPAARWLGVPADSAGRVEVGSDLRVAGLSTVFAVGDTAAVSMVDGKMVPGLAPAAQQGGRYVASQIRAMIESRKAPPPFRYRHRGSLATIGRKAAVADFGPIKLWGAPAWWLWGLVHIGFLVGVRNRTSTLMNWFWAYLTFGAGIRLITGPFSTPEQGNAE